MKTKSFIVYCISTVALTGAGFAAGYLLAPGEEVAPLVTTQATTKTVMREDTTALALAQSQIDALRAERASLVKQIEALSAPSEQVVTTDMQPPPEERPMSPRERMEELKKTDPERYAVIQERRTQWQQRMEEARAKRDDFLGSVDLTLLTEEQQETHTRYTEALLRQEEIQAIMREKFENGESPTDEERQAMGEAFRTMRELQAKERVALLSAVGTSMGLPEEDVRDFATLVQEVYDATSRNGMPRMQPPPPLNN